MRAERPEQGFWQADRTRYGRHGWLVQPAYWTVAVYRFGRWVRTAPRLVRAPAHGIYFVAYSFVRLVTGIDLPRTAQIGPGLLIHHFGGIVIHPLTVIGAGFVMRHGVTLGAREGSGAPVIGDDVRVGAYAQILGNVSVGSGSNIGALTLILSDVEPGATMVGIPGRALPRTPTP